MVFVDDDDGGSYWIRSRIIKLNIGRINTNSNKIIIYDYYRADNMTQHNFNYFNGDSISRGPEYDVIRIPSGVYNIKEINENNYVLQYESSAFEITTVDEEFIEYNETEKVLNYIKTGRVTRKVEGFGLISLNTKYEKESLNKLVLINNLRSIVTIYNSNNYKDYLIPVTKEMKKKLVEVLEKKYNCNEAQLSIYKEEKEEKEEKENIKHLESLIEENDIEGIKDFIKNMKENLTSLSIFNLSNILNEEMEEVKEKVKVLNNENQAFKTQFIKNRGAVIPKSEIKYPNIPEPVIIKKIVSYKSNVLSKAWEFLTYKDTIDPEKTPTHYSYEIKNYIDLLALINLIKGNKKSAGSN